MSEWILKVGLFASNLRTEVSITEYLGTESTCLWSTLYLPTQTKVVTYNR